MKTRWVLIAMLAIVVAGVFLADRATKLNFDTDVDVVTLNGLLKSVENEWPELDAGVLGALRPPFAVADRDGTLRYESKPGLFVSMNEAIKHRNTIVDVTAEGEVVGKLVVPSDFASMISGGQRQLARVIAWAFFALAALAALYAFMLHVSVFRPFKKLERFAVDVARGNLDLPLEMGKHNPFGAFTESFDIMREELAAARQSEYEANRSKKELVASLSHDVKTPVASIKAVSELMLLRAGDEKTTKQLNMIYSKAEQIDLLVTDLFHATLEEIQQLKVNATEELSSVLEEIIDGANYDDRIRWDGIPPCVVLADATRLRQVLDNVLSNAFKYAGTDVTIRSRIHEGFLELRIMDYGAGVDPDELPLVSNKFYRGSNADKVGGTGLGLYISKTFMEQMEGELGCENRDDGFTVVLRLKLS